MMPRSFWPFYVLVLLSSGLVIWRWRFAARLFGTHLAHAAALSFGRLPGSSVRLYFLASIFGTVSALPSAWFDLAPPGIPLLLFVLGILGLATLGLPPSFFLVGGSASNTVELSWQLQRLAPLSRIVHMLLLPAGFDATGEVRGRALNWHTHFVAFARSAKVIVLDLRGEATRQRLWEIEWLARHARDKTIPIRSESDSYSGLSSLSLELLAQRISVDELTRRSDQLLRSRYEPTNVLEVEVRESVLTEEDDDGGAEAECCIRCPTCRRAVPVLPNHSVVFCNRCSVRLPRLGLQLGLRLLLGVLTVLAAKGGLWGNDVESTFRVTYSLIAGEVLATVTLLGQWQHRTRYPPMWQYLVVLSLLILVPPTYFRLSKPGVLFGYIASDLTAIISLVVSLRRFPLAKR